MSVAEKGVKRKRTAIIVSIVAVALSLLIAIYLIVGLLLLGVGGVIIAVAASSISDVDKGYRYDTTELNGGCAITYAFGKGDAVIPEEIDGLKVLVIYEEAFMNDDGLTSVVLPSTLTSIDTSAFYGCTSLKEIIIPDSVEYIGDDAFAMCTSLEKVTVGHGTRYIGNGAFSDCTSLKEVVLGNHIEELGMQAFYSCTALEKINIPLYMSTIGEFAFFGCESLVDVNFDDVFRWWAGDNAISSDDLFYDDKAATFLKETYNSYKWERRLDLPMT